MRTCKDISDDLVKAKRRCETSFKLREKSNRDGNVEFHPIFLATKTGRVLKITLAPCYYHPHTGEPMSFAWTKFYIDEGPIYGAMNRLKAPTPWSNISSIPYETLYTNNKIQDDKVWTAMNAFRVLDSVLVFLHDNYDSNIANKIIPYKKWWGTANISYFVYCTYNQPTLPKKGYAKLDIPFFQDHFRDLIEDEIEMNRHMLDMHVLRNANKLSTEARLALKSNASVAIPVAVNLNEWIEDYIGNILNPVSDKIHKIMVTRLANNSLSDFLSVYIEEDVLDQAMECIDDIDGRDLMDGWTNTFDDRLITEKDLNLEDAKVKW